MVTSSSVAWLRRRLDLKPMNSGDVPGYRVSGRDPADVLMGGGQPVPTKPVRVSRQRSARRRRAARRRRTAARHAASAASTSRSRGSSSAARCRHSVVVVDRGQLEIRERLVPWDRRPHPQGGEVAGPQPAANSRPAGSPPVAALERPQRRLEDARVPAASAVPATSKNSSRSYRGAIGLPSTSRVSVAVQACWRAGSPAGCSPTSTSGSRG